MIRLSAFEARRLTFNTSKHPLSMRFSFLISPLIFSGFLQAGLSSSAPSLPLDFHALSERPGHVQFCDVDNDGKNDLALHDSSGLSWIRYPDREEISIWTGDISGDRFDTRDMDGDGDIDIVASVLIKREEKGLWNTIAWWENPLPEASPSDHRNWQKHDIGLFKDWIKDLMCEDIDGSGTLDVAVRAGEHTTLFFDNDGDWVPRELEHPAHEGMALGDLDADGDVDIVLNGFWLETPDDPLRDEYPSHDFDSIWYTQTEDGWRKNNCSIDLADVNRDGLPDIFVSQSEREGFPIALYMASSPEAAKADRWQKVEVARRFDWCQSLSAGDIDNDGDIDLLAAKFERQRAGYPPNSPPYPVAIFFNEDGLGQVWRREDISQDGIYAGMLGDWGSDGDLDIAGPRSYWVGPVKLWENQLDSHRLPLGEWSYVQVDSTRSRHETRSAGGGGWFGLAFDDINRDGFSDIISGKWFYRNPGGDMTGRWDRIEIDSGVDGLLALDVDGDTFGDVIGLKPNRQIWYEATDEEGNHWQAKEFGDLPAANHGTSIQGYTMAQIDPGGRPELVMNTGAIYVFSIPEDPEQLPWPYVEVAPEKSTNGEGIAAGDIDGDGDIDLMAVMGEAGEKDPRHVGWWENPGDGQSSWVRHVIGEAIERPDRVELADMNGDQRMDAVWTEELYPGLEPEARLYWFEAPADPKQGEWTRHTIVQQYTMNNLDVADMDRDGDMDIITGEHKGPLRVQVWENHGNGVFSPHEVGRGKESHLGTRSVDLDGDGDLDVVSLGWVDYQSIHLWRNDALKNADPAPIARRTFPQEWRQPYAIDVQTSPAPALLIDKPIEFAVNFTDCLRKLEANMDFQEASIQVQELDVYGELVNPNVPFQWDRGSDYDRRKNASGIITLILEGRTDKGASRFYRVLFDHRGSAYARHNYPLRDPMRWVHIHRGITDEGFDALRLDTPYAMMFYQTKAGGFSSIQDLNRKDWISYNAAEGSAGQYRGIPNISGPDFHPGDPSPPRETSVVAEGPLKILLTTRTPDGQWEGTWTIYPNYQTYELKSPGTAPYWFLYEGTPGGSFEPEKDYMVLSDGRKFPLSEKWDFDLPSPEWLYFSDPEVGRALAFYQLEDDQLSDQYWPMQGNMTVFGFSRGRNSKGSSIALNTSPVQRYVMALLETDDFDRIREAMTSAGADVQIEMGEALGVSGR